MRPSSWYRNRTVGSMFASVAAVGGDHEGELARRVPVQRPLALQHAGEVTEERHAAERVLAWTGIGHQGMVGR